MPIAHQCNISSLGNKNVIFIYTVKVTNLKKFPGNAKFDKRLLVHQKEEFSSVTLKESEKKLNNMYFFLLQCYYVHIQVLYIKFYSHYQSIST